MDEFQTTAPVGWVAVGGAVQVHRQSGDLAGGLDHLLRVCVAVSAVAVSNSTPTRRFDHNDHHHAALGHHPANAL
jgi:2-methylcitrate dehydratase PrpD